MVKYKFLGLISFSALLLSSCGGGSDTGIVSPGELSQIGAPTATTQIVAVSGTVLTGSCPTALGVTTDTAIAGNTVCAISGTIKDDLILTGDVIWRLFGKVEIGVDVGGDGSKAGGDAATLSIPAGVTVVAKTADDYIVIHRGSKIQAKGTASKPIVFTHSTVLDGTIQNAETARGLWGGIVILGRAPINKCSDALRGTAGCENLVEGMTNGYMGGALPEDNSGTLQFVRVEHAGYEIFTGNELNGITFGAVGSGTKVDYVQVHNNEDDCVEFFGGTVNVKHLVCTNAADDNLDIDWGYTGKMQYVLVKQSTADDRGDHIVESDNVNSDEAVGYLTTPRSSPKIANFTFISNGVDDAIKLKEGVSGIYMNGIINIPSGSKAAYEHTFIETTQDAPGFDKVANHSVYITAPVQYAAGDDSVTSDALGESIKERATNLIFGTSTLVGGYFLGSNESALVSAHNNEIAVCATGSGTSQTNPLCPNGTQIDSFFSAANYIGAFAPGSDEENNWAAGWTKGLFTAPVCPTGTTETGLIEGKKVCTLEGIYTSDITLSRGNYYALDGKIQIGTDMGSDGTKSGGAAAILTIEAGVTLFGESGSDYLVIMRGSKINAIGTRSAPIIMTAKADINGQTTATSRGLWGGLVILGKAQLNKCAFINSVRTLPCERVVEGSAGDYMGGEINTDNSGILKYVRVQYAGYEIFEGNELNGITFGGVGSGTTVDFVQVHNNEDDCVEFFGGTVNVKHLICTAAGDDNLDIDWGYRGKMQFVIVKQASDRGDHIVESDNVNSDNAVGYLTELRSQPQISNFTFISNGLDDVIKLKEGVSGIYKNGIVVDATNSKACLEHTFAETLRDGITTPKVTFNSVAFDCKALGAAGDDSATAAEVAALATAGSNNLYSADSGGGSYVPTLSGVINGTAENAITVTAETDSFFTTTTYIGAVKDSTDTWYKDWTVPGSLD